MNDLEGKRLRFGANAEFFLAEGIETYDNGVIKLGQLKQPTTFGYIFGGIMAKRPSYADRQSVRDFICLECDL